MYLLEFTEDRGLQMGIAKATFKSPKIVQTFEFLAPHGQDFAERILRQGVHYRSKFLPNPLRYRNGPSCMNSAFRKQVGMRS